MHRLGLAGYGVDQLIGDPVGVAVQDTHPVHPLYLAHRVDQLRQAALTVNIFPVAGGILRHQVQLGHAAGGQLLAFLYHIFHGPAAESAPDERNGAVAAPVVAALGHLHIGKPRLISQHPFPFHRKGLLLAIFRKVFAHYSFPYRLAYLSVAAYPQHHIRLRDLPCQLLTVALRQAAGHRHTFQAALALGGAALQYRVNGFLLGVLNKAAGVHDHRVTLGHVIADRKSIPGQHRQQALGVHLVFAAPQRDHSHFNRHGSFPPAPVSYSSPPLSPPAGSPVGTAPQWSFPSRPGQPCSSRISSG